MTNIERIYEICSKLKQIFYDTPDNNGFFDLLAKAIIFLDLTDAELTEMYNNAIYGIRKTRISIADVCGDYYDIGRRVYD